LGTEVKVKEAAATSKFGKEMKSIQVALEAIASIEEGQQQFALDTIATRLGLKSPTTTPVGQNAHLNHPPANTGVTSHHQQGLTPKAFLAAKKPTTAVEQMACLAYYLTHQESKPHFKTKDLTDLNTRAAADPFTNAGQANIDATRQSRFLAPAGKGGLRQITARGEEVVNAMPDREAVKTVLSNHKGTKSKQRKRKKKD
jgi:hypothetical protein